MTGSALSNPRLDGLDALRGLAMLWMTAFHFSFDLNQFGLIARQDFYRDPFWTLQRLCIVSSFLFCAGLAQAVVLGRGDGARTRSWRRWWQVVAAAALVSAGSALMFPRSWISFGVLHSLAVMLLLARLAPAPLRHPAVLLGLGALALLLPAVLASPAFDSRWTNPIGLVTRKPVTEDYVPLLPWLAPFCFGLALGQVWQQRGAWPAALRRVPAALRPLVVLGRWSLSYYLLHQPVLIGLLMGVTAARRALAG